MYKRITSALGPYAFLPLRLGIALAMILHGWLHVTDVSGFVSQVVDMGVPHGRYLGYGAVVVELLGGILLLVGFHARTAAFLISVVMAVAVVYHDGHGYFASDKGIEVPLLLCLGALTLLMGGPGRASVDSLRGKL